MSLTATIQALHERISRSAFRNLLLWGMLMLIFLFIYGAMAVRGGYHWDETLDFAGQGMYTYLANGRWGLVLWRCIFGHGCAVWLNSLLAGGLLCAAIIVQLRVLRVEHTGAQLVYALLYMLQIQFAYQMDYAYQCDATAAGILATSWAALQLQKGGLRHLFYATAAVLFAIAVYQSLALNFVVLLGLVMLQKITDGQSATALHTIGRACLACAIALVLWFAVKTALISLISVPDNVLTYCREYAERINYREQLFSAEWYLYLFRMLGAMAHDALLPFTYDGEPFYAASTIAGIILAIVLLRRAKGGLQTTGGLLLLLGLWIAPFSMYMVVGETWPCYPHTKLAQPIVLAGFWMIALRHLPGCAWWRRLGVCALVVCSIQAASLVTRHAENLQARFEERLHRLQLAESQGVRLAIESGITPKKGCILYYADTQNWRSGGLVDFCGDYPALLYMQGATDAQLYRLHKQHLQEMPEWPAHGAVRVVGDKVIIKGGKI